MGGSNHICPWWLCYSFDNPVRRLFHDPRKMLGGYLKPGMRVLDIGCGMGYFSLAMAKMVGVSGRVIALDLQGKTIEALLRAEGDRRGGG